MQLEWSRYIEGIANFKENQGMLWVICIFFLVMLWLSKKIRKHELFLASAVLGMSVVFPITAVALLKFFTPFYNWADLQQAFPVILMTAVLGTESVSFLKEAEIPGLSLRKISKTAIAGAVIIAALFVSTGFHGFDVKAEAGENGVPKGTSEVFTELQQVIGDAEITLAAPHEMLTYARLFSADWHPIYGRDLWSGKSASYINSGYNKEYQYYNILSNRGLTEEKAVEFTVLINEGDADCVIIPDYWLELIGEIANYEKVDLVRGYIGIVKKEIIAR